MNLRLLIAALAITATASAQDNTWIQKKYLPAAGRLGAIAFTIGNKAYVGTGYLNPGTTYVRDLWQWDQASDTWTQKADFAGPIRAWATSFSIDAKGYLGMGDSSVKDYNDFWQYDTATNAWTKKANYPGGVINSTPGFVIGRKGYIVGTYSTGFWEYDPDIDTWTLKSPYPGLANSAKTAFTIGNKAYVGLGLTSTNVVVNDFWEYDPATDIWTQKANFGGGQRHSAVGFGIGTRGFIGSGFYGSAYDDFWEYEPTTDKWTQRQSLPAARCVAVGFAIGNKGYIGTGYNGNAGGTAVIGKELWEYTPLPALGVTDAQNDNNFTVYPNPVISNTTVHMDKPLHDATLTIVNAIGQQVQQIQSLSGQKIVLQRNNLPAGVYTLYITQDNKSIASGKLMIAD